MPRFPLFARITLMFILIVTAGCTGNRSARLEAWESGAWKTVPMSSLNITGRRAGAETHAEVTLVMEDGRRIEMQLTVAYNPTPVLAAGRWECADESGDVVAESLRFLGGQAEGPSLGGRFRLEISNAPRYRMTIPSTTLTN